MRTEEKHIRELQAEAEAKNFEALHMRPSPIMSVSKVPAEIRNKICDKHAQGKTYKELAEEYSIGEEFLIDIVYLGKVGKEI